MEYDLLRERARGAEAAGADEQLVLGRLDADHGDPAAAVERLRVEWGRQPGTAVADALGWALHRAGADEEALEFATIATDGDKGGGCAARCTCSTGGDREGAGAVRARAAAPRGGADDQPVLLATAGAGGEAGAGGAGRAPVEGPPD